MNPTPAATVPILVVEQDDDLRSTFAEVFAEEGYTATFVSSLSDAYQRLDTETYALVLTDLFVGRSPYDFSEAHRLRRHASPTPVGVLTTQSIVNQDAQRAGFAFGLRLPFDVDELLGCVAAAINQRFTPQQHARAEIVQRSFNALESGEWLTVLSHCVDDVAFYPPRNSVLTTHRRLHGKSALLAYVHASGQHFTNIAFTNLRLYSCPRGISARYLFTWMAPDETWHQVAETTHFHFDDLLIRQVGVRVRAGRAPAAASNAC